MATPSLLLYADSAQNADQLYFGRVNVPDPFLSFTLGRKKYAIVNRLEFGRVKRESAFDDVIPLEPVAKLAREKYRDRKITPAELVAVVARELGIKKFVVPEDFPVGVATRLTQVGLKIEVADGAIFPQREIKTDQEARAIQMGNRASAAGIAAAEGVLRASRIKGRTLIYQGKPLTSERLKVAIETACLEAGAVSLDTIAAGGDQACDPHHRGSGPLRPNELIIVDVFPRVTTSGYYGDMTRTFLKGRASNAQHELVAAVRDAQSAALKVIKAGVAGKFVHQQVLDVFSERGYETRDTPAGAIGFFHGTGHGVGLAIHEAPRVNGTADNRLRRGTVVTVEPGLYYPGLGGCRIEDVVQVTEGKPKLLSKFHYEWEIK